MLDPTKTHKGGDLLRLARAMTALQVRPQVSAYGRLAKELRGQEVADVSGTARLGQTLGRNIAGAYRGFDQGADRATQNAAAVGQMGLNQVSGFGQQANAELARFQKGQLGGLQEAQSLRGAPGGGLAQQQLQDLVAGQQARQVSQNQGARQFAAAQSNAYTGLAQGIRQAGALQGAAAQSGLASTIASQMAELRLKAGQDIREALGKKAEAKALKGQQMIATLGELTKGERDYILGLAATKTDQAQAAETARSNREDERAARRRDSTTRRGQNISHRDRVADDKHSGGKDRKAHRREVQDIKSQIRDLVAQLGHWPKDGGQRGYLFDQVEGGHNNQLIHHVYNSMRGGKGRKGGKGRGRGRHGGRASRRNTA